MNWLKKAKNILFQGKLIFKSQSGNFMFRLGLLGRRLATQIGALVIIMLSLAEALFWSVLTLPLLLILTTKLRWVLCGLISLTVVLSACAYDATTGMLILDKPEHAILDVLQDGDADQVRIF